MVSLLDQMRHMLEDLGDGRGVTDPVSGEVALRLWPQKAAKKARPAAKRAPARRGGKKRPGAKRAGGKRRR
jgi:hypothetical protein